MLWIVKFIAGRLWAQIALVVLGAFVWWKIDQAKQFNAGVKAGEKLTLEKSKEQGKKNAAASKKAHDAARKPGAFERLRNDPMVCRECKGTL